MKWLMPFPNLCLSVFISHSLAFDYFALFALCKIGLMEAFLASGVSRLVHFFSEPLLHTCSGSIGSNFTTTTTTFPLIYNVPFMMIWISVSSIILFELLCAPVEQILSSSRSSCQIGWSLHIITMGLSCCSSSSFSSSCPSSLS